MNRNTATKLGFLALLSYSAIVPVALGAQQTATDPFIWLEETRMGPVPNALIT